LGLVGGPVPRAKARGSKPARRRRLGPCILDQGWGCFGTFPVLWASCRQPPQADPQRRQARQRVAQGASPGFLRHPHGPSPSGATEGAAHDLTGAAEKDPGTRLGLARSLDWLSGHRVRRCDNAVALSGQFGRFEVATGLLNTQEVRFEPKTARLTTQEVRFDGKRNFKPPKRQSRGSGVMKRSRKVTLVKRRRRAGMQPWASARGPSPLTQPGSPERAEGGPAFH